MSGSYLRRCTTKGCKGSIVLTRIKEGEARKVTCPECRSEYRTGWKPFLIVTRQATKKPDKQQDR